MDALSVDMMILVVGDMGRWHAAGHSLPKVENTAFCEFNELDQDLLLRLKPDIILSSLASAEFDILDLVKLLDGLDYLGRVRVLTTPLPDKELVRSEVIFEHPAIDFDLIEIPHKLHLRGI